MAEEVAEQRRSEFLHYDAAYYAKLLFEAFYEIFSPFVAQKILSPSESLQPGIFGVNPDS